jgi:hypothetical protein
MIIKLIFNDDRIITLNDVNNYEIIKKNKKIKKLNYTKSIEGKLDYPYPFSTMLKINKLIGKINKLKEKVK